MNQFFVVPACLLFSTVVGVVPGDAIAQIASGMKTDLAGQIESDRDVKNKNVGLIHGGAFKDLILDAPTRGGVRSDVWGAEGVLPRDTKNGIEDDEYSYWGGNILVGDDGKNHLFVCRWPEDNVKGKSSGHHTWWSSQLVRAVSDYPLGPYRVVEEIGPLHNPEAYRKLDGTYVIGGWHDIAYTAATIEGPWTRIQTTYQWDQRQQQRNETNHSYVVRQDGSVLMINKSGLLFESKQPGQHFVQIRDSVAHRRRPNTHDEDPVMWKDEVQYHLIINDATGRRAIYKRSPDGFNWHLDPGVAYDPTVVRHPGGLTERWYKLERPKIRQDRFGRATHLNFAAIDVPKSQDLANDNHSSKNVVVPLVVPRRLELVQPPNFQGEFDTLVLRIRSEDGFDPRQDVAIDSLILGAPQEVDRGRGCRVVSAKSADGDLLVTFGATGHGVTKANWTVKLIGQTTDGQLLVGYARLP